MSESDDPLLPVAVALHGARLVAQVDDDEPDKIDNDLAFVARNDMGNARRMIARYGRDLMYLRAVGWFYYVGTHWDLESGSQRIQLAAQETATAIRLEAKAMENRGPFDNEKPISFEARVEGHRKFGVSSGNTSKIAGMITQAEPHLTCKAAEIDAHPWLFNVRNGTLDLKNISGPDAEPLREHSRGDRITHLAQVDFDAEAACPLWHAFLADVLPDAEVRNFIQRWFGYALTGDTGEQCLVMFQGQGANGKSTIIDVLMYLMGDYALTINFSSLLHDDRKRGSEASPDLARLPGVRLVVAAEPEIGARFSEGLIKTVTGGDTMTVRHLNRDFFEFMPSFKLTLAFNNKPSVRGQDEGIWRRMLLVPFENIIPKDRRDPQLKFKLRGEASGILNWALDGLRLYAERGLAPPEAVTNATKSYRDESDPFGEFIVLCMVREEYASVSAKDVYDAYCMWCRENTQEPRSGNAVGRMMSDRGFVRDKLGTVIYRGGRLTDDMHEKLRERRGAAVRAGASHD